MVVSVTIAKTGNEREKEERGYVIMVKRKVDGEGGQVICDQVICDIFTKNTK